MNRAGYVLCTHCNQTVSKRTFRRHVDLQRSCALKRSFNGDSSASSSDAEVETECNANNWQGKTRASWCSLVVYANLPTTLLVLILSNLSLL